MPTQSHEQPSGRPTSLQFLEQIAAWANEGEHGPFYPLALLRAARRGLGPKQTLAVVAVLPSCEIAEGYVADIGARLCIRTTDDRLIEDIEAGWVISAEVR